MVHIELPCYKGDYIWYDTYTDNGKTFVGRLPHKITGVKILFVTDGADVPLCEIGRSAFINVMDMHRRKI